MCSSSDKTACRLPEVHQLQQPDTAARMQSCYWFRSFLREGFMCSSRGCVSNGTHCICRVTLMTREDKMKAAKFLD
jgi:hypothetical protein